MHAAKKDVYGLLLPEGRKHPSPAPNVALVTKVLLRKSTPSDSDVPSGGSTEDGGPVYAVVKRRKKNPAGQRNRRSVLHGTNDSSDGTQAVSLNETSIQLISVASESDVASQEGGGDAQGGVAVRSRVGKVSDLVKQFDGSQHGAEEEEEEEEEEKERGVGGEMDRGEGGSKKRLSRNTLEMFEKTGIIMGMVSMPHTHAHLGHNGPRFLSFTHASSCMLLLLLLLLLLPLLLLLSFYRY